MDKLKYIKLENVDGSYSAPIPFSVSSDNVDVDGETLTDVLDSLNGVDIDTSIDSQSTNNAAAGAKAVYDLFTSILNANEMTW